MLIKSPRMLTGWCQGVNSGTIPLHQGVIMNKSMGEASGDLRGYAGFSLDESEQDISASRVAVSSSAKWGVGPYHLSKAPSSAWESERFSPGPSRSSDKPSLERNQQFTTDACVNGRARSFCRQSENEERLCFDQEWKTNWLSHYLFNLCFGNENLFLKFQKFVRSINSGRKWTVMNCKDLSQSAQREDSPNRQHVSVFLAVPPLISPPILLTITFLVRWKWPKLCRKGRGKGESSFVGNYYRLGTLLMSFHFS